MMRRVRTHVITDQGRQYRTTRFLPDGLVWCRRYVNTQGGRELILHAGKDLETYLGTALEVKGVKP
ncbi:MAG TPA: hypothetical protein VGO93_10190 [Candidatus Xenobia bacterium]